MSCAGLHYRGGAQKPPSDQRILETVVLTLVRFAVLWVVDALSILGAAWLLSGVTITPVGETPAALIVVSAALLLPIVVVLVYVVGSAIVALLLADAEFTLQSVLANIGVQ